MKTIETQIDRNARLSYKRKTIRRMVEALDLAERALENVTNDDFKQKALLHLKRVQSEAKAICAESGALVFEELKGE